MQGFGGGGMVPVASSILVDAFPPEKRGQAFALFGVAVAVAPVVGPTLGGWLSDNLSWHWCFLINGPVGVMTLALITFVVRDPEAAVEEQRKWRQQKDGFDVVGFVLVATFLGTLEIVLDRGLEDDWFGSSFITTVAILCALAFVLMIPWEMTRRNPTIDIQMVATRQFGACFLVMLATGALLLATTQFLPQLVQADFGYTATWAGVMVSPGGVVAMVMMFVAGRLVGKIQPKYLIAAGAVVIALSMYALTNIYGDLGFWFMARSRMLFAAGTPTDVYSDHRGVLRRHPARQDRPGLGLDQRGTQYRRLDRHLFDQQRAVAPRAVPSEHARRPGAAVERPVSRHAASDDELFRRAGQSADRGAAAGHCLGRAAGAAAGVVPRLYGRLLGADAVWH